MVAKCRCTSDDTPVTQGRKRSSAELNSVAREIREKGEIIVRVIRNLCELVHDKQTFTTLMPPLAKLCVIVLEVKCNYLPIGMEASNDPEVEVSQLRVDQNHQPDGGLCCL